MRQLGGVVTRRREVIFFKAPSILLHSTVVMEKRCSKQEKFFLIYRDHVRANRQINS